MKKTTNPQNSSHLMIALRVKSEKNGKPSFIQI
jgi:hypothetical protein